MFKEFLNRRALTRATRGLAPRMEHGERLIAFDICRTSSDLGDLFRSRGVRVDVVVSDRALYLVRNGDTHAVNRLPFDDIARVGYTPPPAPGDLAAGIQYAMLGPMAKLIVIHLWDNNSLAFMPYQRNGRSAVASELQARVPDRTVATHRIELLQDGRGVTVTQSTGPNGSIGFNWDFTPDDGINVDSGALRGEFSKRMYQLMRDAGDLNAEKHATGPAAPDTADDDLHTGLTAAEKSISSAQWSAWEEQRATMAAQYEGLPPCPVCGQDTESVITGAKTVRFEPCGESVQIRP
ncbi:hypothetical protein ACFVU0_34685 [Streptomyces sp. NPDC058122]|uniref:hypothetical protein n=1 Tax=Streptomyces sp. NPDC058122 TaxID=3346349 RepID=UPI0036F12DBF